MVTTRKRLETASAKLDAARAEGSDLVDALQTGVDKTRTKLEAAEKALHDYQQANATPEQPAEEAPADAAQAAIQKAMAARAAEADKSPEEKARDNLQKLEARLAKSEARLQEGRAADEEEKIIIALESTVERLKEKVAQARAQLEEPEAIPALQAALSAEQDPWVRGDLTRAIEYLQQFAGDEDVGEASFR